MEAGDANDLPGDSGPLKGEWRQPRKALAGESRPDSYRWGKYSAAGVRSSGVGIYLRGWVHRTCW